MNILIYVNPNITFNYGIFRVQQNQKLCLPTSQVKNI